MTVTDTRPHCDGSGWFYITDYPWGYWTACPVCNDDECTPRPYDPAEDPMPADLPDRIANNLPLAAPKGIGLGVLFGAIGWALIVFVGVLVVQA